MKRIKIWFMKTFGKKENTMVKEYRKKPVVIKAIKWEGWNLGQVIDFTGLHRSARKMLWCEYERLVEREGLRIFTLEGKMNAEIEDFIIKGIQGEFYPCKPDIFAKTYEEV